MAAAFVNLLGTAQRISSRTSMGGSHHRTMGPGNVMARAFATPRHTTTRKVTTTTSRKKAIPTCRSPMTFTTKRSLSSSGSQSTRLFSKASAEDTTADDSEDGDGFFANADVTFESMGVRSSTLLERLEAIGLTRPTTIQARSFRPILYKGQKDQEEGDNDTRIRLTANDVTIGAETGSGKTLAYLLPLMDDILYDKQQATERAREDGGGSILPSYDYARAIILVPNKELVQQVLRMAVPLCGGTIHQALVWGASGTQLLEQLAPVAAQQEESDPTRIVRMAIMPGGLNEPLDFKPFRDSMALGGTDPPVDLVVTTPAALGSLALKPKHIGLFADLQTLVVDEADMLLDGGYIRALEQVLVGFRRADRLDPSPTLGSKNDDATTPLAPRKTQHIFSAATLPDMGLKSVDAYLQRKFPHAARIQTDNMHNAKHYGLMAPTQWYLVETKKERMEGLVAMLMGEDGAMDNLQGEKVMVFLNSVEDVEGVHEALSQRGIMNVLYHAKISLLERAQNLDRFRKYQPNGDGNGDGDGENDAVPILICTDLASRGLDVPGVTAVVQLQFSGNVVSHLHRMGRCGRAGQRTGRGIVFYDETEAELVRVVQEAETQQERMQLEQDVDDIEVPVDAGNDSSDGGGNSTGGGKVKTAFSRKRGFTKKRKKLKRQGEVMG